MSNTGSQWGTAKCARVNSSVQTGTCLIHSVDVACILCSEEIEKCETFARQRLQCPVTALRLHSAFRCSPSYPQHTNSSGNIVIFQYVTLLPPVQAKNNKVRAGELEGLNKVSRTDGDASATEATDLDSSKENASGKTRPAAGFTRTLIAKTERPSTTTSLVQRTENLQLDSHDGTVCLFV